MITAQRFFRTAFWWLHPRNPQITTYFNTRIVEPQKGRPSEALLRALREQRERLTHSH